MNISELLSKCNSLSPVEEINGLLYKRDDLFKPFEDIPLTGGKLRQAICLLDENKEAIETLHGKHVVTTSGIHSPQGIILARCSNEFGFRFTMVVNGLSSKEETLKKHNIIRHILNLNGEVDFSANCNWDNALVSFSKKKYPDSFLIKFGINAKKTSSIIDCNAFQTRNLPNEIENLIIPVGSGITMAGIMKGLKLNNIKVKRIIGVQISGHDYRKSIDSLLGIEYYQPYEFIITGNVAKYSVEKEIKLTNSIILDPLYEAKAYDYINSERPELLTKDSVFWIVGNAFSVKHEAIAPLKNYSCVDRVLKLNK